MRIPRTTYNLGLWGLALWIAAAGCKQDADGGQSDLGHSADVVEAGENGAGLDAHARPDTADLVSDVGPPPPRRPLSSSLRQTLDELSPAEGIGAPVDTTNEFATDPEAIALGQRIFFETAISGNGAVSCASCHRPDYAFTEPTPRPEVGILGPGQGPGRRTPSLLNVGYNIWFFWDGRIDTLWGQAVGPYESPIEMGGSRLQLAHHVYANPEIAATYQEIFGPLPAEASLAPFPPRGRPIDNPVTASEVEQNAAWESMTPEGRAAVDRILVNIGKSLAAYQMQLLSTQSPFDRFAEEVRARPNDPESWSAISAEAQEGFRLFVEVGGCLECHRGPLMADDKFHNVGVDAVPWADPADVGRLGALALAQASPFSSAGTYSADPNGQRALFLLNVPEQRDAAGAFRTPTLRNAAKRAPFMHAGQHADLEAVVKFYNEPPADQPVIGARDNQVDALELNEAQVTYLVEFLKTLDGEPVPAKYLVAPSP